MVFIRNIVFMAIAFAMLSSVVDAKRKGKDYGPLADRDTWREITQGCERVMLFVFFPWCEHCRNLHGTWDGLRDEFKDDKTLCFMANDCDDDEGDKFCQDLEVNGAPEIYWGTPASLTLYDGPMDKAGLQTHIKENMTKEKMPCNIMNIENCPEGDREVIAKIEKLTTEYMEAIQKLGVSDPIKTAQQAVKKNLPSSKNKFWRDIADIDRYNVGPDGYEEAKIPVEEQVSVAPDL